MASARRAEDVRVHDFLIKELGRACLMEFMIWPPTRLVNVGVDNDTATFACRRSSKGGA